MSYLLETLLILGPEGIAKVFLCYDCQPFSENILGKAIRVLV